jgi:membrane fusion protein (multidrug efflux system)
MGTTSMKTLCGWIIMAALAPAQAVEVVKVAVRAVERKSRLPGEFLPYLKVDLHARVTGFVDSVEVDVGSPVKRGQLLARLRAPEMAAQIAEAEAKALAVEAQRAEAEAKAVAAESMFTRMKEASATPGVVARHELILAEKSLEASRAVLKALDSSAKAARASVAPLVEMQSYLNLTAPFDGVITERIVHPGALVGPSSPKPLLVLEQVSRLRLVVPVPETDVAGVARGVRLAFTVPAHPGRTFAGVVARIPQAMDTRTRTMAIELDVDNTRGELAPGMYPEVHWQTRRPRASLLVPPTSVATTTERSFVVRVRNGRAEWVDVTRGPAAGDLVEVVGPLAPGDVVVRRATDEIRDGSAVTVK